MEHDQPELDMEASAASASFAATSPSPRARERVIHPQPPSRIPTSSPGVHTRACEDYTGAHPPRRDDGDGPWSAPGSSRTPTSSSRRTRARGITRLEGTPSSLAVIRVMGPGRGSPRRERLPLSITRTRAHAGVPRLGGTPPPRCGDGRGAWSGVANAYHSPSRARARTRSAPARGYSSPLDAVMVVGPGRGGASPASSRIALSQPELVEQNA
jgi:hypothetical protein